MKIKHRLLTVMLALAMLMGMAALPAAAEASTATEKADAMYELGLFKGTDVKADGTPEYSLNVQANRAAAATMLVRLLGKESEAQTQYAAGTISSPFTDLSWEAAMVTWLYANNMANGMTNTEFGGTGNISAQQFATFILRALGYSDSGSSPDFTYAQALPFAVEKQIITEAQSTAYQARFLREGMVEMCYNALYLKMNGSPLTLMEKLTNDGAFDKGSQGSAPVVETKTMTLTEKYKGGGTANPTYMEEQCLGNAVCDDIDGDGKLEIVFGVRSIFCANAADGKLKWRIADSETGGQAENGRAPFQVLDFDGDGRKEIFAMTFSGTKATVNIIDASGTIKTAWAIDLGYNVWAGCPSDLDGDGKYELVIGVGVGGSGAPAVYVYNNDGSVRSGWPQTQGYGLYSNSITTVDLDGDGKKEIVLTYDETQIVAFHADGSRVSAASFGAAWDKVDFFEGRDTVGYSRGDLTGRESRYGLMGTKSGIIADDVDGDGRQEIIGVALINDIAATYDRMNSAYDDNSFSGEAKYFAPYILSLDRTRYRNASKGFDWSKIPIDTGRILSLNGEDPNNPSTKISIAEPDYRPLTADVDGDGFKEIIYTANDGQVHCFSLDGMEHGAWPFALSSGSSVVSFASRPTAADVNGDGKLEVIFATYTPMGQTAERGKLYVLDCTGKKIAEATLPHMFARDTDSSYANGSRTSPIAADIDNDGSLEIVVATYNCGLVAYEIS